jgi:hypothetical protein
MRLHNLVELQEFMAIVNSCKGAVWLESAEGDKINLRSNLSQYVALGALLQHNGSELELYCSSREDEAKFIEFFHVHPMTA